MKYILIIFLVVITTNAADAQTRDQLQSRIRLCKEEAESLEASVEKYKELMAKQLGEILEVKKEIHKLNAQIAELNTERDQLVREKQELEDAAMKFLNLAQKWENDKREDEAIKLYNVIIDAYPTSSAAVEARNILRSKTKK